MTCLTRPSNARADGTRLDERARTKRLDYFAGAARQQRSLGTRKIILRKTGDLLEQLGTALVIEVLRRQLFLTPREPLAHVGNHCAGTIVGERDRDLALDRRFSRVRGSTS